MLKTELSLPKKSARISLEDCRMIHLLLKRGMSFKDCLDVLESDKNGELFKSLRMRMEQGEIFKEVIGAALDKKLSVSFRFFIGFLSVDKSLECCLSLADFEDSFRKEALSKCTYPSVMLLCAVILILMFNRFFFPVMIDLLAGFGSDTDSLRLIGEYLQWAALLFLLAISLILPCALFCLSRTRIAMSYCVLVEHFNAKTCRQLVSYRFARFFLQLLKSGCSTRQSIRMMRKAEHQPILNLISFHVDEQLLMGKSLKEAFAVKYFDPALARFMAVGALSSSMETLLENYCAITRCDLEKKLKRITHLIQGGSYMIIGIALIFIYRILLSPMTAISQL